MVKIKELIFAPIVALLILSMGTQLVDIATSTSEKTLNYANEMDASVDCAFRGVPIEKCSASLTETDFEPEIKEYINFSKQMADEIEALEKEQERLRAEIAARQASE